MNRVARWWWEHGAPMRWRAFRIYGQPPNGTWLPSRIMQIAGGRRWSIALIRTEDPQHDEETPP